MSFSARILANVVTVNAFDYATEARFQEGDAATVYVQLVSPDRLPASQNYNPSGLRYMPQGTAALAVTIDSIDVAKKITRSATQPFAQDPSIWSFPVLAADALAGTMSLNLQLTETVTVGQVVTTTATRARLESVLHFGSSSCRLS